MKIVGLMLARNEAWIVGYTLRGVMQYVDDVVFLDHGSTDDTLRLVEQVRAEYPGRIHLMHADANAEEWPEMHLRQATLAKGRDVGGTHFVIADADELLTANHVAHVREWFAALEPGELIDLPMVAPWRGLLAYRDDDSVWSRSRITFGFRDAPDLTWAPRDGYQFHCRPPHNSKAAPGDRKHPIDDKAHGGVMHLQWVNWRRLTAKHAWYKMQEAARWPEKRTAHELNRVYGEALDERHIKCMPMRQSWLQPYDTFLCYADLAADGWQAADCRRMLEEYGPGPFEGLDLFGVLDLSAATVKDSLTVRLATERIVATCLHHGIRAKERSEYFYERFLPAWIRAHHNLFRGWKLVIYHDESIYRNLYGSALAALHARGLVELRYGGEDCIHAEDWNIIRYKPAWDLGVEYIASRDIDSLPTPKDRRVVQDFIDAQATRPLAIQAVHDHEQHNTPMMIGMVTCRPDVFMKYAGVGSWDAMAKYGSTFEDWVAKDGRAQDICGRMLWPKLAHVAMDVRLKGGTENSPASVIRTDIKANLPADVVPAIRDSGDIFMDYLGAPGFDYASALEWYQANGDPEVEEKISAAEASAGDPIRLDRYQPAKARAIFSSVFNRDDARYTFLLPFTAAFWRFRTGLRPTILACGGPIGWHASPWHRLALLCAREVGADIHFVPVAANWPLHATAQMGRLFACQLPLADDCYLVMSDADMWPLSADFFRTGGVVGKMDLYSSGAYTHEDPHKQPMCYVGGDVAAWREMLGVGEGHPIARSVAAALKLAAPAGSSGVEIWNADERYLAGKLAPWMQKGLARIVGRRDRFWNREPGTGAILRADRNWWPEPDWFTGENTATLIDAHVPRHGWQDEDWQKIFPLVFAALPPEWAGRLARFRDDFVAAGPPA